MNKTMQAKYDIVVKALADLCAADNCNYLRRPTREAGLFEAGRVALAGVGVDRHRGNPQPERPELVEAAAALLERLDNMTTHDFSCGGEGEEREALRTVLGRMITGNDGEDEGVYIYGGPYGSNSTTDATE